eukprot:364465-Chlamydomonas_euryale.AAC.5
MSSSAAHTFWLRAPHVQAETNTDQVRIESAHLTGEFTATGTSRCKRPTSPAADTAGLLLLGERLVVRSMKSIDLCSGGAWPVLATTAAPQTTRAAATAGASLTECLRAQDSRLGHALRAAVQYRQNEHIYHSHHSCDQRNLSSGVDGAVPQLSVRRRNF